MLPGADGFAIARALREAQRFTPILMLTARSRPEDILEGLEAGADDYLPQALRPEHPAGPHQVVTTPYGVASCPGRNRHTRRTPLPPPRKPTPTPSTTAPSVSTRSN